MAANSLGRAVLEIGVDTKELVSGLNQINRTAAESAKELRGMAENLNLAVFAQFGKIAGDAVRRVAEGIVELGQRGAQVSDVSESFRTLSARAGETGATMLGALREGVQGTLSNFDLMQMANKGLGAGLVRSADDAKTLAAGAKLLADRMGIDTKDAFEKLTSAIASGRTSQLKQLGLFVDTDKAVQAYAASHGKAVKDLTDHERAAALAAGTLAALKGEVAAAGEGGRDFGDVMDHARAVMENLRDAVAVAISQSPVLRAGLSAVSEALESAFGAGREAQVQAIADVVGRIAIAVVGFGQVAVRVAAYVTDGFYALRYVFNSILEAIFAGVGKLTAAIAGVAEKAAKLPLIGNQFKPLAESFRQNADLAKSLAFGFGELAQKAVASSNTAATAFGQLQNALAKVKGAMVAAQGTVVETGNVIRQEFESAAGVVSSSAERGGKAQEVALLKTRDLTKETTEQNTATHEAAAKATLSMSTTWAEGIGNVFTTLAGKNKVLAIAGAMISTYAAVAKTMASIPWPASIPAAAAALAAGLANVAKIKSAAPGYATGTAGLDFQNFGTVSPALLHGEEAVVPRGSGHKLAAEIAASLPKSRDAAMVGHLRAIRDGLARLPDAAQMKRAFRDGLLLANA